MMTRVAGVNDRREKNVDSWQFRIERGVKEDVSKHDDPWSSADPKFWQAHYRLLGHLENAGRLLMEMGPDTEMAERHMLGLNHDIGKIFEPYSSLYRKNGNLTPDEKIIMEGHSWRGEQYVLKLSLLVRVEDREIFYNVATCTGSHHTPWLVEPTRLRKMTWDLFFLDGFLAGVERRHDESKSTEASLKSVSRQLEQIPQHIRHSMNGEIEGSITALRRLVSSGAL